MKATPEQIAAQDVLIQKLTGKATRLKWSLESLHRWEVPDTDNVEDRLAETHNQLSEAWKLMLAMYPRYVFPEFQFNPNA